MDGAELLQKVRETYAGFSTYSDVGTFESAYSPGPPLEFQTHFKRPEKFRLQWPYSISAKPKCDSSICSDGDRCTITHGNEVEFCESFALMIARATAVSGILYLLVAEVLGPDNLWQDMSDIQALDSEVVYETECFHLTGRNVTGDDTEAWIEKDSYLVRRIRETTIVTEAKRAEIIAALQSEESLELMGNIFASSGLAAEAIELAKDSLPTFLLPMTYQVTYSYSSVIVDQTIHDSVFQIQSGATDAFK